MRSIKAKYALVGQELKIEEDIEIELDQHNVITTISSHSEDSNLLVVPGHFNAHVHAADIGIRGEIGDDLHLVVGPGGIKSQYLDSLTQFQLLGNIRNAINEGMEHGILGFVDFRENGVDTYQIYDKFPSSYVPHIRPKVSEFDDIPMGGCIGVRDVIAYDEREFAYLRQIINDVNGRIEIHASEDIGLREKWIDKYGVSDIAWAISNLQPKAIVHATLADDKDIQYMKQTGTGVIVCPTSNRYFKVGQPPVQEFLSTGLRIGIGSDNAMVNTISLWDDIDMLKEWNIPARKILLMATINGAFLSGVTWGVEVGNSNFLVYKIPMELNKEDIFEYLTDRENLPSIIERISKLSKSEVNN